MPGSQVLGSQARPLGDPREHARTDLLAVVEGEGHVGPAVPLQDPVRGADLTLDPPPDAKQRGEDPPGLARWPRAHAGTANRPATPAGTASPCSTRSARVRRARAWTR